MTGNVSIYSGSTLTLGADMTLSGNLDLRDTGSTLDMAGHTLTRRFNITSAGMGNAHLAQPRATDGYLP